MKAKQQHGLKIPVILVNKHLSRFKLLESTWHESFTSNKSECLNPFKNSWRLLLPFGSGFPSTAKPSIMQA